MPHFGRRSMERLLTCDIRLQEVWIQVVRHFDCTVLCGFRSEHDQTRAFRAGASRLSWPKSKHNRYPAWAVDVAPWFTTDPHVRWDDTETFRRLGLFARGVAAGMNIPLRWGGDWDGDFFLNDQTFNDLAHYELIGDTK